MGSLIALDRAAFFAVNHGLKSRALDFLMPALTDIGLGHVQAIAVVALALFLGIRAREMRRPTLAKDIHAVLRTRSGWVVPLLICFFVSGFASTLVKASVSRDRPWWYYEKEHSAGRSLDVTVNTVAGTYPLKVRSFPSGHTATTVAMATVVTVLYRRRNRGLVVAAWVVTGIVGVSRMYLGSHWPSDVLGGAIIGAASGWLSILLCRDLAARERGEPPAPESPVVEPDAVEQTAGPRT